MIIVHTPEDGGPVERFDCRSIRTSEASIITSLITDDVSWQQVKGRITDDDPDVLRVIVYVLKKRSEPSLRIADFDPPVEALTSKLDRREIEVWAEATAEKVAVYDGPPELLELSLAPVLDQADDTDHAKTMIQRILSGKFPAAPEATPGQPSPTTADSTS